MQRSNTYILFYTLALTVFCGVVLSLTAMALKPLQDYNVEQERKINIVSTFKDVSTMSKDEAVAVYDALIEELVVDVNGNKVDTPASELEVLREYKKPLEERLLPVYIAKNKDDKSKAEYYIVPTYGAGLWNNISGYVALQPDINTIEGARFGHVGETPGLGARIADDPDVYSRYEGKQIFDENGILQSVVMQKGEGNKYDNQPHKIDGMSGATLTANGVNNMLREYFGAYEPFFKSISKTQTTKK